MRELTIHANAKINLTLEVLGRREDGYHEIASVMQTIGLFDELRFAPSDQLTLHCNLPELEDRTNLVLRAAELLKVHAGYPGGAEIYLDKHIPLASGLGGGSSDAAATLVALNQLWGLDLGHEDLLQLAAALGSDVPFFLRGGTALAEGRGEKITPLPPMCQPQKEMVLLVPPVALPNKTATMYGRLTPELYTDGRATRRLQRCLDEGERPSWAHLFNVFSFVAAFDFDANTEAFDSNILNYRRAMLDAGAPFVFLAGSGPALFTFGGQVVAERLRAKGYVVYEAMAKNRRRFESNLKFIRRLA